MSKSQTCRCRLKNISIMNKEFLEKAGKATSCDELLSLANGEGIELDRAKAGEIFSSLKNGDEITDDLLSSVSGGRIALERPVGDKGSGCSSS